MIHVVKVIEEEEEEEERGRREFMIHVVKVIVLIVVKKKHFCSVLVIVSYCIVSYRLLLRVLHKVVTVFQFCSISTLK